MTYPLQLTARGLSIDSPTGRPLFRDLHFSLVYGDRAALVGRNGIGKTTLLETLAGKRIPTAGSVFCTGARSLVSQLDSESASLLSTPFPSSTAPPRREGSPGELRRRALEDAFAQAPAFLLLDEPSLDLDQAGVEWLVSALQRYPGASLVVTHDRRVLECFDDFFVAAESGCHHHHGTPETLLAELAAAQEQNERRYLRQLEQQLAREAHYVVIERRRERKKNVGRVRELRRCPARAKLNAKRSYAQVSQANRAKLQADRLQAARDWTKAVRRSLAVFLPLEAVMPSLPPASSEAVISAAAIPAFAGPNVPPQAISLSIRRERWGITGPNGCGKSTLLETLLYERTPVSGRVTCNLAKVGYIGQNATNWHKPESLLELLCFEASQLQQAANIVAAHHFPVALAQRPLSSLSPGERMRAALIALFERRPAIELLALDEPTNHLDLLGIAKLERVLRAWPGGLLVVSHDSLFLHNIGIEHQLSCGTNANH